MATLSLEDAREYIIPLFLVDANDNGVFLQSREFLGTAFFVTAQGDAITACHVIPDPGDLPDGKRVVAIVQRGDKQEICWITHAAVFQAYDLALIHVNLIDTKFLQLSEEEVLAGTDIQLIGIPSHELWLSGKEMRVLKGHVTLVSKELELNISIPLGMSGSPLFLGTRVIGFATRSVKSEEVEDSLEELEVLSNSKEQIRITKIIRVTHYGMAFPFFKLRGQTSPIFEGKTLAEFIKARNHEP
jgi:hypothetical protein